MKRLAYLLFLLVISEFSLANDAPFAYDKNELNRDFSTLNELSAYVDQSGETYSEMPKSKIFQENFELTNDVLVKPNLKMDAVDWGAFAWGFCCWPIGVFVIAINDDKDKDSKNSFVAGIASSVIVSTVAYIAFYAIVITSFGAF